MVQVERASLFESEMTRELMSNISQGVPAYMVSQIRKMKLTKAIRRVLQQEHGVET